MTFITLGFIPIQTREEHDSRLVWIRKKPRRNPAAVKVLRWLGSEGGRRDGMEWIIFTLVVIVAVAHIGYLERHRIRQIWSVSSTVANNLAPHEKWPQILHWRKGDEFDPHIDYHGKHYYSLRLIAVTEDGFAYCNESNQKVKIHVSALVGHNESVVTRAVEDELKQSNEYMDLLREFNVAVDELKKRDGKLKMVS